MIDGLPSTSRYFEAQANDDEYWDAVVAWEEADKDAAQKRRSSGPSLREWSLEAQLLAQAVYRIGEGTAVQASAASGKKSRVPAAPPSPETGYQRALMRARAKADLRVRSLFAPHTLN